MRNIVAPTFSRPTTTAPTLVAPPDAVTQCFARLAYHHDRHVTPDVVSYFTALLRQVPPRTAVIAWRIATEAEPRAAKGAERAALRAVGLALTELARLTEPVRVPVPTPRAWFTPMALAA